MPNKAPPGGAGEVTLQPCRLDDDSVPHPLLPGTAEWDEWLGYVTAIPAEAGLNAAYAPRGDGFVTCREALPAG